MPSPNLHGNPTEVLSARNKPFNKIQDGGLAGFALCACFFCSLPLSRFTVLVANKTICLYYFVRFEGIWFDIDLPPSPRPWIWMSITAGTVLASHCGRRCGYVMLQLHALCLFFFVISTNSKGVVIIYKCKKLKQFKTPCKDDMVNSHN